MTKIIWMAVAAVVVGAGMGTVAAQTSAGEAPQAFVPANSGHLAEARRFTSAFTEVRHKAKRHEEVEEDDEGEEQEEASSNTCQTFRGECQVFPGPEGSRCTCSFFNPWIGWQTDHGRRI
jgi:hypothetical protein